MTSTETALAEVQAAAAALRNARQQLKEAIEQARRAAITAHQAGAASEVELARLLGVDRARTLRRWLGKTGDYSPLVWLGSYTDGVRDYHNHAWGHHNENHYLVEVTAVSVEFAVARLGEWDESLGDSFPIPEGGDVSNAAQLAQERAEAINREYWEGDQP